MTVRHSRSRPRMAKGKSTPPGHHVPGRSKKCARSREARLETRRGGQNDRRAEGPESSAHNLRRPIRMGGVCAIISSKNLKTGSRTSVCMAESTRTPKGRRRRRIRSREGAQVRVKAEELRAKHSFQSKDRDVDVEATISWRRSVGRRPSATIEAELQGGPTVFQRFDS